MKILYVINSLKTGGAERLIVDIVSCLKSKGIDVEVLLLNGNETPFFKEIQQQGITIHSLNNLLPSKKIAYLSVFNPLHIMRIIPYLKKYDVVHAHLCPTLYWVALAKLLSFGKTPLVYTEHNTNNKRRNMIGIKPFEKIIYRQYSEITCVSEKTKKHLSEWLNLPAYNNRLRVVYNGINLSRFETAVAINKQKLNLPDNARIILMTARFIMAKDPDTLIKAFNLIDTNTDSYLVFVGDGNTREKSEALVKKIKIENRVRFLGTRPDVPEIIKASDICVLSSHWEGMPLTAVEAMASGKPFIASDVPGLRDVVAGAGLLFKQGDEKDLAEKINSLLNNPKLYEQVACACLKRAEQYDINLMVERYLEICNTI